MLSCDVCSLHTGAPICRFGAASYVPSLALEKPLYIRERNDGLYRPITYLLAKLFDELFITLFSSVVFALVVWYLIQVRAPCPLQISISIIRLKPSSPDRVSCLTKQCDDAV